MTKEGIGFFSERRERKRDRWAKFYHIALVGQENSLNLSKNLLLRVSIRKGITQNKIVKLIVKKRNIQRYQVNF